MRFVFLFVQQLPKDFNATGSHLLRPEQEWQNSITISCCHSAFHDVYKLSKFRPRTGFFISYLKISKSTKPEALLSTPVYKHSPYRPKVELHSTTRSFVPGQMPIYTRQRSLLYKVQSRATLDLAPVCTKSNAELPSTARSFVSIQRRATIDSALFYIR